jgi:membrane protease YdiL (CAAX protease family)
MTQSGSRQRSPLTFFVLVFALAVPFWLLGALVETPEGFPIELPLSALQLVCPLLAASILVYREDGTGGIRRLLARVVRARGIKPIWYVPIILVMPAIYLLAYGLQHLLGRPLPAPQSSFLTVLILCGVFFIAAAAEEAGWTGYALDPLQARRGALPAAIVLGLVWALFHLVADLQGPHGLGWIAWHRFGAVALRVLTVWAYNNTGASVLAAVLLHATDNVGWQLTPINGSSYDPALTAPITAAAAVVVSFLWGPKTLARYRYASPATRESPLTRGAS